jgi:hypothetical protein
MERASFLVSTALFFISVSLYFLITVVFRLPIANAKVFFGLVMVVGVANGFLTSRYFVKTGRYLEIINGYNKTSMTVRRLYGLLGAILFFGSLALLIFSGITTSRYLRPW